MDYIYRILNSYKKKNISKEKAIELIDLCKKTNSGSIQKFEFPHILTIKSGDQAKSFTTEFYRDRFYAKDHKVNGSYMIPAVTYIEMIKSVIEKEFNSRGPFRIENMVWLRALTIEEDKVTVKVNLIKEKSLWKFEVLDCDDAGIVYCQGNINLEVDFSVKAFDIDKYIERCHEVIKHEDCYDHLEEKGISYGSAFQVMDRLYMEGKHCVSKLNHEITSFADSRYADMLYTDGLLQTAMGVNRGDELAVPFMAECIDIIGSCKGSMTAIVETNDESTIKRQLALCYEDGGIAVQITGLIYKSIGDTVEKEPKLLLPIWKKYNNKKEKFSEDGWETILFRDAKHRNHDSFRENTLYFENFMDVSTYVFKQVKQLISEKKQDQKMIRYLFDKKDNETLFFSGIVGLLKTVSKEFPKLKYQIIELDEMNHIDEIGSLNSKFNYYKFENHQVYYQDWELSLNEEEQLPWKDGGVYLVTGGTGGLGKIFAEEIVNKVKHATLYLLGRKAVERESEFFNQLKTNGCQVSYIQCDICSKDSVKQAVDFIINESGKLDGILHCAGINSDSLIVNKELEVFSNVLLPKVNGTMYLEEMTRHLTLDFFLLFSSSASILGNIGQSDYAAANSFMNEFAESMKKLRADGQENTRYLSMCWPLWEEGGMKVSDQVVKHLKQRGIQALGTKAAIRILYLAYSQNISQALVLSDGEYHEVFGTTEDKTVNTVQHSNHKADIKEYLRDVFAKVTKIPKEKIRTDMPFDFYGVDSVMIIEIISDMEKDFGVLSKSLLFEYKNLKELAVYFNENHGEKITQLFETHIRHDEEQKKANKYKKENLISQADKVSTEIRNEEVAIIGLSGMYPMASSLDELWDNLSKGRDCIEEIPSDRWDYKQYFTNNGDEVGMTSSKWGGFIKDYDKFDPLFFQIPPSEAELMDPQDRLFLQCVEELFQDSGYSREQLSKQNSGYGANVGVYVGAMYEDYQFYGVENLANGKALTAGGSLASIANRVSYYYNLHGPSLTLDTMCSSSLTAIALAYESIRNKSCDMAVAGGVNLSLHPHKYAALSQGNFLSSNGRCTSFGENGNGYVPGEGVGAILLKPLSKAKEDGDNIYGVIRGVAMNHGGRTNGYTVPNPIAQSRVISEALNKSEITPDTINYIEAHGTGTALGDPIEINALNKIYHCDKKQYCAIGSIKSNIGHCEAAAGIAGLTKILLQMKHKKIVSSLHSKTLNKGIDFTNSAFYVPQVLENWEPVVKNGEIKPRRAGLSAFGAGGSNAHLIIEEYQKEEQEFNVMEETPAIIVFSAASEEQNIIQAENLLKWMELPENRNYTVQNIAYTLQMGRSSNEYRVGFVAKNRAELSDKLFEYIEGNYERILRNRVKYGQILDVEWEEDEIEELVNGWINDKNWDEVLSAWMKGTEIAWNKCYKDSVQKISLPHYPFKKKRFWIDVYKKKVNHLQTNDNLTQHAQLISIMNSHKIDGIPTLPGAVYFNLVYQALIRSGNPACQDNFSMRFTDVIWHRPYLIDEDTDLVTNLETVELNHYQFLVAADKKKDTVYCTGDLYVEVSSNDVADRSLIMTDTHEIKESVDIYDEFGYRGIEYDGKLRMMKKMLMGDNCVCSEVILKSTDPKDFITCLVDAAFQTTLGLNINKKSKGTYIPCAIDSVVINHINSDHLWIHTSLNKDKDLNIKIFDDDMRLCGNINGVTFAEVKENDGSNLGSYVPNWVPIIFDGKNDQVNEVVIFDKEIAPYISHGNIVQMPFHITGDLSSEFHSIVINLFEFIKKTVKERNYDKYIQIIYQADEMQSFVKYNSLRGFVLTCRKEYPKLKLQLVSYDNINSLKHFCENRVFDSKEPMIKIENSNYFALRYTRADDKVDRGIRKKLWKNNGVYLITGGAGALGQLFAEEIARSVNDAAIILLGRRTLTEEITKNVERLCGLGADVSYISVDITNNKMLKSVIANIRTQYKHINGIIHSAGLKNDSLLINKKSHEIREVLDIKVSGTIHLDLLTQDEDLDVFLLFGSNSGALGNVSQLDYATANSFMSEYAEYRNKMVQNGQRKGVSICIDWPLWKDGGMTVDAELEQMIMESTGAGPLTNGDGMKLFYHVLDIGAPKQLIAAEKIVKAFNQEMDEMDVKEDILLFIKRELGSYLSLDMSEIDHNISDIMTEWEDNVYLLNHLINKAGAQYDIKIEMWKIKEFRELNSFAAYISDLMDDKNQRADKNPGDISMVQDTIEHIKEVFSEVLKLDKDEIDATTPFERYGLSSINILKLTDSLEKTYGLLPKTLLYEYQTIEAAAEYLNHLLHQTQEIPKEEVKDELSEIRETDIAVIGMAGSYPQASNINKYWNNLLDGVDCITEIPNERWDKTAYFDAEKSKPGKIYSKWGGFLDGVYQFDPVFFHISPREAYTMDPQERLFLKTVYHAIEDSGYKASGLDKGQNMVGVFAGAMYDEYPLCSMSSMNEERIPILGNTASIANRVSFMFDFHGPSMCLNTMCSSGLSTIHLACESLLRGESNVAIAGGVNISIHPNKYLALSKGGFLSSNGRCMSFGEGGDGYVPGEGVGAFVLKRYHDAVRDGDFIYGIIKGTAVNHGGRSNGYTVPNLNMQAQVISKAIDHSGVDVRGINYIETHGTGTQLGDPIEIAGLSKVFKSNDQTEKYCALGSVKSNIGHCESAAGAASVTKVLLQFKHKQLVPSLRCDRLNSKIDFNHNPFYVQKKVERWENQFIDGKEYPLTAGISAFGAGGSNAHIILQEFLDDDRKAGEKLSSDAVPIVLTTQTIEQLNIAMSQLLESIECNKYTDEDVYAISYTLWNGREHQKEKLLFMIHSMEDLKEQLTMMINRQSAGIEKSSETDALINKWENGVQLDWMKEITRKRIPLPGYPFKEKNYEINELNTTAGKNRVTIQNEEKNMEEKRVDGTINESAKIILRPLGDRTLHSEDSDIKVPDAHDDKEYTKVQLSSSFKEQKMESDIDDTEVTNDLVKSLADVLFLEKEDIHNSNKFIDLGLDSVVGVEWVKKVNEMYGLNLSTTVIYDHPTIKEFAQFISGQLVQGQKSKNDNSEPVKQAHRGHSNKVKEELRNSLSEILYLEKEEIYDDLKFVNLGLDSVIGVEWVKEINKKYKTNLSATLIYDYPTLKEFSEYMENILDKHAVETLTDDNVIEKVDINTDIPYGYEVISVMEIEEMELQNINIKPPAREEITIEVKASAINFPDIMCVKGIYPTMPQYPFVPGFEVSGKIVDVGEGVSEFKIGDEVIAITGEQFGGHASHVNVTIDSTVHKPNNISFEEACSLPIAFMTVWHALEKADIKANEKILIQTATGACGLVAQQIARYFGCKCYTTSSKDTKIQLLESLGVEMAVNYKNPAYVEEILEKTGREGMDIVVNMLSGSHMQEGLDLLASNGRYVELAMHGLKTSNSLDLSKLTDNQQFISIDLRKMGIHKRLNLKKLLEKMILMIEEGVIVPIVSKIYPMKGLKEALKFVSQGQHIGKVVISHDTEEIIDFSDPCMQKIRSLKKRSIKSVDCSEKEASNTKLDMDIAIIGMSGEFPGAKDLDEYWEIIKNGDVTIEEVPDSRWPIERYYDPDIKQKNKSNSKWMGIVTGTENFDPLFFNISPNEAKIMEPQQRIFLENCWKCIEDAGIKHSELSGKKCGVFVGAAGSEYGDRNGEKDYSAYSLMGDAMSILGARISYLLNLKGPCVTIETACSSSLTAIAQACNSLVLGECDQAIAGGVYTITGPLMHIRTSNAGMLSADGKCHAFDESANGFVPSEGVGAIYLKKLNEAVKDGNRIYGVIKGWGVNQDGATNGITAPSSSSQMSLETEVYKKFNIDPDTIGMIEAHGTGTKLGDPIEVEGLTRAFQNFTSKRQYCSLGSVKANIGHTMMAAGVASVIKVLLCMKHHYLPPLAGFRQLNSHISLKDSPFYINQSLRKWEDESCNKAAISSFGFSGTNAHMVIQSYENNSKAECDVKPILLLSAKRKKHLDKMLENISTYLSNECEDYERCLYTLQNCRDHMRFRFAVVANSKEEAIQQINLYLNGDEGNYFVGDANSGNVQIFDEKNTYDSICESWVMGSDQYIDADFFRSDIISPVSLPHYPFEQQRFWIDQDETKAIVQEKETCKMEHLEVSVDRNDSYIFDHVVNGKIVLPAALYIEYILSILDEKKELYNSVINDLVIHKPVMIDQSPISLQLEVTNGEHETSIRGTHHNNVFITAKVKKDHELGNSGEVFDVRNIPEDISNGEFYKKISEAGFEYGNTYRTVQKVGYQNNKLAAEILLADSPKRDKAFTFHPALIDGALQISMLLIQKDNDQSSVIPYSFSGIQMRNRFTNKMSVVMMPVSKDTVRGFQTFKVELYNDIGELSLVIGEATFKNIYQPIKRDVQEYLFLEPKFEQIKDLPERKNSMSSNWDSFLFIDKKISMDKLDINPDDITYYEKREELLRLVFDTLKHHTVEGDGRFLQFVICTQGELLLDIVGMIKSINLENTRNKIQVIQVDDQIDKSAYMNIRNYGCNHQEKEYLLFRESNWYERNHIPIPLDHVSSPPWIEGGVYFITGGLGELGLMIAKDILHQAPNINVILAGRRELDDKSKRKMEELLHISEKVQYFNCDISEKEQCESLIQHVLARYGKLTGMIHCAASFSDSLFREKSWIEFNNVWKSKVNTIMNISHALGNEKVDFLVMFSSIASVLGNYGQSCYAAANGYLDSIAATNTYHLPYKKIISINWPLWQSEKSDEYTVAKSRMKNAGMEMVKSQDGLQVLHKIIKSDVTQVIALAGDQNKMLSSFPNINDRNENLTLSQLINKVKRNEIDFEEFKNILYGEGING